MASPEPSPASDSRDWELLETLFSHGGAYRHRMGLRRFPAAEFYAPTTAGPTLRAEKEAILRRTTERHTLITEEGHEAAMEFARLLGLTVEATGDCQAFNRKLGLTLEPDLLVVQPPDWSLVWANVCFPSRWSLEGKARRPLTWIHDAVPELNDELADKIATFFSRLVPGEGWRRANWGLSASPVLNQHPAESIPALDATIPSGEFFVRIEDQHLLKLPVSGMIAFGIRITNFTWAEILRHPGIATSVLEKLKSMPPEIACYKGLKQLIPPNSE